MITNLKTISLLISQTTKENQEELLILRQTKSNLPHMTNNPIYMFYASQQLASVNRKTENMAVVLSSNDTRDISWESLPSDHPSNSRSLVINYPIILFNVISIF